ncbi:unnamed protein product [Wuchereria bancrofti]|uniref:Uncharacterized protein n=1 Tax=Wuchereria bancrofti TaxID=6293 RepID=A0A3P7FNB8_WUCBA|nr:unnamed protein product [Wuchereria bancrofti]
MQGDTLPRPVGTQIVKVLQGKETPAFKEIFVNWNDRIAVRYSMNSDQQFNK